MASWAYLVITASEVKTKPNKFKAESECCICFDMGNDSLVPAKGGAHGGRKLTKLACSHTFHSGCLAKWAPHCGEGACPVCKGVFRD